MAISQTVEEKEDELAGMSEDWETPTPAPSSSFSGLQIEPGEPHQALFLVLNHLPLFELIAMSSVCVSLRDAVQRDVLPWLRIIVDKPVSSRMSDEILMRIASKANGRLGTLALIDCFKITDDGLLKVVEQNPLLIKLYVPGCTSLTPEGVLMAVKTLSQHSHSLNSLMINGIYNLNNEHLKAFQCCLQTNRSRQLSEQPLLYHEHMDSSKFDENTRMIDVESCPRCNQIRKVFYCTRQTCKFAREKSHGGCRACNLCIPRCEECGGCVEDGELEEVVCADVLCSSCWLQLPKCNCCNRPYCKRHNDKVSCSTKSIGFICEVCCAT